MSAEYKQQVFWPQLASLSELDAEDLGGSFSKNVRVGKDGIGMRWNKQGEAFPIEAIYKNSEGQGTEIAPGTFEAIFVNYKDRILKVDSQGNGFYISKDNSFYGSFKVDSLFEGNYGNTVIMIDDEVSEVVLKKWGKLSHSDKPKEIHPKARPNPNKLDELPVSVIEHEFNELKNNSGITNL